MKRLAAVAVALMLQGCAMATDKEGKEWQSLFDGRTLEGWRASDEPGTFAVSDGEIVVRGPRSHLFYVGPVQGHEFRDFEL
jgi:hypothetical protein